MGEWKGRWVKKIIASDKKKKGMYKHRRGCVDGLGPQGLFRDGWVFLGPRVAVLQMKVQERWWWWWAEKQASQRIQRRRVWPNRNWWSIGTNKRNKQKQIWFSQNFLCGSYVFVRLVNCLLSNLALLISALNNFLPYALEYPVPEVLLRALRLFRMFES